MKFFAQCRASNMSVNKPILMEKARKIELKLNARDAYFSNRLLHMFKMWHGISCQTINRKSKDVLAEKFDEWLKNLPNTSDGYNQSYIYNVDENGLFIISYLQELSLLKVVISMVEKILKITSLIYFEQTLMAMIRRLLQSQVNHESQDVLTT